MSNVTYYVAVPFLIDADGSPVAGTAEECQSSTKVHGGILDGRGLWPR